MCFPTFSEKKSFQDIENFINKQNMLLEFDTLI